MSQPCEINSWDAANFWEVLQLRDHGHLLAKIKEPIAGDVKGMEAWEMPLVSPLEVSTIWTAIIQPRIPCSTRKHRWEICIIDTSESGQVGATREARRQKSWEEPRRQPSIWELKVGLSLEREEIRCGWHFVQKQRFSGDSFRNGQYELQLSPVTWTGTAAIV